MTWAACVGLVPVGMRHISKGAVRAFLINGGRRGGAAHLLNGAEARSSRRPLPTITGWGVVVSPAPSVLHVRHVSPMRLGWQTVETGNRVVVGWGGGSVLAPCAFCILIGRAGRPSPNPDPL